MRYRIPSRASKCYRRDGAAAASTEWAGNKDVYVMDIRDEDHAQDVLGQLAPIFEKYDVVMSTMMATC